MFFKKAKSNCYTSCLIIINLASCLLCVISLHNIPSLMTFSKYVMAKDPAWQRQALKGIC